MTGGLPALTATADEVYARTYPRVARKNAEFHARYPGDVPVLRRIADHLDAHDRRAAPTATGSPPGGCGCSATRSG